MQYFIHGDDFGRNPSKAKAIDVLIHSGKIHTTSLLVNLDDTDHAVEFAKKETAWTEYACI